MGKILHTSWGGFMLGVGMTVEAVLFALGAFDKPHKEYDWGNVYDFENGNLVNAGAKNIGGSGAKTGLSHTESISEDDVKKLSEGIKNLSTTANQLSSIANVAKSTDNLVKNIDSASEATGKFINSQDVLNAASLKLETSYKSIADGIQTVDKNTKDQKNTKNTKNTKKQKAEIIQNKAKILKPINDKIAELEKNITNLETEIENINQSLIKASIENLAENIKNFSQKLNQTKKILNQNYEELEIFYLKQEEETAKFQKMLES
jgi:gliding motility-associated protein GldL